MTSTEPLRSMPIMTEMDAPLGRDAGRDNARHWAAVAIFSLTGVAVVGVAGAWFALRDRPAVQVRDLFDIENATVSVDMPTLRPRFDEGDDAGPAPGSFTFLDDATGVREVVEVAPKSRPGFDAAVPPTLAR